MHFHLSNGRREYVPTLVSCSGICPLPEGMTRTKHAGVAKAHKNPLDVLTFEEQKH